MGTFLQIIGYGSWVFFGLWQWGLLLVILSNMFGDFWGGVIWFLGAPILTTIGPIVYWLMGGAFGSLYMKVWGLMLLGLVIAVVGGSLKGQRY